MNPADAMPFSRLMGVTVTAASADAVAVAIQTQLVL
jgi:hypothetical protein